MGNSVVCSFGKIKVKLLRDGKSLLLKAKLSGADWVCISEFYFQVIVCT